MRDGRWLSADQLKKYNEDKAKGIETPKVEGGVKAKEEKKKVVKKKPEAPKTPEAINKDNK